MLFNLPQELWLYIFRLAASDHPLQDTSVHYIPFDAIALRERDQTSQQSSLNTKRAIVLVCRAWYSLATEVLYETLRIRHGTEGLQYGLEKSSAEGNGHGRFAHQVEINPVILNFDALDPTPIPPILAQCTSVKVLVRPYNRAMHNSHLSRARIRPESAGFPHLPLLNRVDWWLPEPWPRTTPAIIDDFLGDILAHAPNIKYLTLGEGFLSLAPRQLPDSDEMPVVRIPSLTTLRLECEDIMLLRGVTWSLPRLTHLIIGEDFNSTIPILRACGALLKVVELMRRPLYYVPEALAVVLESCPNLEELNYFPGLVIPFNHHGNKNAHPNLKCVRLHPHDSDRGALLGSDPPGWPLLVPHLRSLILPFPTLERIVLYDLSFSQGNESVRIVQVVAQGWKGVIEVSDGTQITPTKYSAWGRMTHPLLPPPV